VHYQVVVELPCLNIQRDLDTECAALSGAITRDLGAGTPTLFVTELRVTHNPDGVITVSAMLRGGSLIILTSPLEAISRLDRALDNALLAIGMFAECDVARKVLQAHPSA
jgi:hypothetical protein